MVTVARWTAAATRKSAPAAPAAPVMKSNEGFPLLVVAILNLVQGQACCNCGPVIQANHELVMTISSQLQFSKNCFKAGNSGECELICKKAEEDFDSLIIGHNLLCI